MRAAIVALARWREEVKSQLAMHLWPSLLTLVEKGVNTNAPVRVAEADDRDFWNRYGRLPGETRNPIDATGEYAADYFVDPLVLAKKPADYFHRSPATNRRRTFSQSWGAVKTTPEAPDNWQFSPDWVDTFVKKVLTKDGAVQRIPVIDLAAWLFREHEFPDGATAESVVAKFRETFRFTDADFEKLFEFRAENPGHIFTDTAPANDALRAAIEGALLPRGVPAAPPPPPTPPEPENDAVPPSEIAEDDAIFIQVMRLRTLATSGIILRGCPGTSKSWFAKQIARRLVARASHIYRVQFHPSYGYEDFVEGYRPNEDKKSGFEIVNKKFMEASATASAVQTPVVFIIDEINRGDPGRVFGEVLTYIEHGYRGDQFYKAYSGERATVPPNLLVIGTMNPHDRSITQLDLALVRRFDHIDVKPSSEMLQGFLEAKESFSEAQIERLVTWFESLQNMLPFGIGQTYLLYAKRPEDVEAIWRHRMLPYCESVLELDPQRLGQVKERFLAMHRGLVGQDE